MRLLSTYTVAWVALSLCAAISGAQSTNEVRMPRRYSSTVTLHLDPSSHAAPETNQEESVEPDIREAPSSGLSDLSSGVPLQDPNSSPARLPPPRKPVEKNWLSGSASDKSDDKDKPSGWGWLADEVLKASEKAKEKTDNSDDEDDADAGTMSRTGSVAREQRDESRNRNDDRYQPVLSSREGVGDETRTAETGRPRGGNSPDAPVKDTEIYGLDQYAEKVFSQNLGDQQASSWNRPDGQIPASAADIGRSGAPAPDLTSQAAPPAPGARLVDTWSSDSGYKPTLTAPTYGGGSLFGSGSPSYSDPALSAYGGTPENPASTFSSAGSALNSARDLAPAPAINSSIDNQGLRSGQTTALPW